MILPQVTWFDSICNNWSNYIIQISEGKIKNGNVKSINSWLRLESND